MFFENETVFVLSNHENVLSNEYFTSVCVCVFVCWGEGGG